MTTSGVCAIHNHDDDGDSTETPATITVDVCAVHNHDADPGVTTTEDCGVGAVHVHSQLAEGGTTVTSPSTTVGV